MLFALYRLVLLESAPKSVHPDVPYLRVTLMKRAAEAGNDLFHISTNPLEKTSIAEYVLATLRSLYYSVAPSSRHQIEHMAALMHTSLAHFESQSGNVSESGRSFP